MTGPLRWREIDHKQSEIGGAQFRANDRRAADTEGFLPFPGDNLITLAQHQRL